MCGRFRKTPICWSIIYNLVEIHQELWTWTETLVTQHRCFSLIMFTLPVCARAQQKIEKCFCATVFIQFPAAVHIMLFLVGNILCFVAAVLVLFWFSLLNLKIQYLYFTFSLLLFISKTRTFHNNAQHFQFSSRVNLLLFQYNEKLLRTSG